MVVTTTTSSKNGDVTAKKATHNNATNSAAISKKRQYKNNNNNNNDKQKKNNWKTKQTNESTLSNTATVRRRRILTTTDITTTKEEFFNNNTQNITHSNVNDDNDQLRDKLFYNHYLYRIITKSMHKKRLKRQMKNNNNNRMPNEKKRKAATGDDNAEQGQEEELSLLQLPTSYPITVSSDPDIVTTWIEQKINSQFTTTTTAPTSCNNKGSTIARKVVVVGMDCEWDPFRVLIDGQLIQSVTLPDIVTIATESSCLLYQTREGQLKPCEPFVKLLQDKRVTKVWYDSKNDFSKLHSWLDVHHVSRRESAHATAATTTTTTTTVMNALRTSSFDLHTLCKTGVNNLCREILSCQLKHSDEGNNIERWSRITLDDSQIAYAAKDAYANLRIFQEYHDTLK